MKKLDELLFLKELLEIQLEYDEMEVKNLKEDLNEIHIMLGNLTRSKKSLKKEIREMKRQIKKVIKIEQSKNGELI